MTIRVFCPRCQSRLKAPDSSAGKSLTCPKCRALVDVPVGSPVSPEIAAPITPPPLVQERQSQETKRCPFCAETIAFEAIKCHFCGSMLVQTQPSTAYTDERLIQPSSPPVSPLLVGLLSGCCFAGLGQIVIGQATKGIVFLLGAMVLGVVTIGFSALVTFPLMGIDAYLVAKKLQSGRAVTQWECFPS